MKKFMKIILSLIMTVSLAGCSSSDNNSADKDQLARIKAAGKIVIATEGDWAPWTYHEDSGTLTGMDVELGRLIAEKLGVEAVFEETDFTSILAGVDSTRFDIACNGVGYTDERALKYNFSDPYIYTSKVLIVRESNTDIHSFADLAGKTTANSIGSTYAKIAEDNGATVVTADKFADTISLLIDGRVDATINSKMTFNDYMAAHPNEAIKYVDQTYGDRVCIPIRQGEDSQSLHDAINDILKELRDNGTLSQLSLKFFGADYTNE